MATKTDKKIPLVEKFGPTIQGEGATIGLQTYFLRFGLCDYECTMCDSMHAVDPKQVKANAQWLTQDEIANLFITILPNPTGEQRRTDTSVIGIPGAHWITFSGGNPCIHDLSKLVRTLKDWGYRITVETQGTFCPSWLFDVDIITVSPKGPGMGEKFELSKYEYFIRAFAGRKAINTKVVIFNDQDLKFAEEIATIWSAAGYSMDGFYLSQGNPFPPGKSMPIGEQLHIDGLRDEYLRMFDKIKVNPILSHAKWLPQFHVWLWSNKQGV